MKSALTVAAVLLASLVYGGDAEVLSAAIRKLDLLNAAREFIDLSTPPGNRLEALSGNLGGLHSIRVNDQWRIVFRWEDSSAYDLRLMDYH